MKSTKEIVKILLLLFIATFCINCNVVFADVGSFESYDSGSSWSSSSSSWDSSSSWSSSSDYDYDSSGTTSISGLILFLIIFLIVYYISRNDRNYYQGSSTNTSYPIKKEEDVENSIKATDELFNKEEFLAWTRDLFVKMQNAWTERDWSTIRTFETNELFEQHQKQIQGYISMRQINVMERICVLSASLMDFSQTGDKDVLSVRLASKMIDYIIDEDTRRIVKGDRETYRYSTYKLVFVRKKGIKTKAGSNKLNTTNCPNCGAPTEVTSSGKCEYCGSVITIGSHNWVLSNLEKIG